MPPPWTWFLLLLGIHIDALVRAGTATADDTDAGMFYSGLWVPDGDPNTFGHHDTWTNQSGASVVFDFIGTQIAVFATRRPTGTYLSNVSFSVDGGPSMLWTTSEFVPEITYKNLVYTSPFLPPAQHRITITNLGAIFWLDYVQWTTADAPPNTEDGEGGGTTTTTKRLPPPPSPSHSPPTTTTTTTRDPPTSSETPSAPPSTATSPSSGIPPETSSAGSDTTAPTDASVSAPISPPQSSASTETGSPSGLAAATSDSSESSSRTPLIAGMAVVGLGALALLLAVFWWLRMRARARARGQSQTQSPEQPTKREQGMSSVTPFEMYPPPPAPSDASSKSKQALSSTLAPSLGPRAPFFSGSDAPSTYGDPCGMKAEPPTSYLLSEKAALAHRFDSGSHTESSTSSASRPLPPAPTTRTSSAVSPTSPSHSPRTLLASPAHSAHSSTIAPPLSASGTDSFSFSSTSPTLRPPAFRSVRHSHDAGIRLAGGPVDDADVHRWTLARYDDTYEEVETLPPSYAQLQWSEDHDRHGGS